MNKHTQNPYISGSEGRIEWNDRYLNMSRSIRNWQLAFFCLTIISIILSIILGIISTQSKIQPYIIETNGVTPIAFKKTKKASDTLLINYILNQFITNAKTILSDNEAEKCILDKVYAYASENSLSFLHEFYEKNNPFQLAGNYTLGVNIINSMPISKNTWQIIWDETKRSASSGVQLEVSRWIANVTYKFGEVNHKFISENPFGIYVTDITWSKSLI